MVYYKRSGRVEAIKFNGKNQYDCCKLIGEESVQNIHSEFLTFSTRVGKSFLVNLNRFIVKKSDGAFCVLNKDEFEEKYSTLDELKDEEDEREFELMELLSMAFRERCRNNTSDRDAVKMHLIHAMSALGQEGDNE